MLRPRRGGWHLGRRGSWELWTALHQRPTLGGRGSTPLQTELCRCRGRLPVGACVSEVCREQ